MAAKRAGLGDKKEGKRLEKGLISEPKAAHEQVQVQEDKHDDTHKEEQVQAQAPTHDVAQEPAQVPAPSQREEYANERLHCFITASQKKIIKGLAKKWNVSMGEVIRYLIQYYKAMEMK